MASTWHPYDRGRIEAELIEGRDLDRLGRLGRFTRDASRGITFRGRNLWAVTAMKELRLYESLDCSGCLAHHVLSFFGSMSDAMPDVIIEQADCDLLRNHLTTVYPGGVW